MNAKNNCKCTNNQSLNPKIISNQSEATSFTNTPNKFDNIYKNNLSNGDSINNNSVKKVNEELNSNNKTALTNSPDSIDENSNEVVAKILDTINKNSLSIFYDSESEFKNKIDSLNLKFYLETEKYLCNQNKKYNTQTSLFIILFKQINIYIEEIQRLNIILLTKKYKPENIKKRTDELTQKKKEFQTKEDIIKALKTSQFNMETKLLQAVINENNLNKKIENLQKEIEIYKNKIISLKNNSETQTIKIDKMMTNSNKNLQNEFDDANFKITKTKCKNSHNSICIGKTKNNYLNKINNIVIDKSIKSKSPGNIKNKEYLLKLRKTTNNISIDLNINKRNHSENVSKSKNNSNKYDTNKKTKPKNLIIKDKIKKQSNKEMICIGSLINKLNKPEKLTENNSKKKLEKESNNNTINHSINNDDLIHHNNYKKIVINNNKNILSKCENLTNRNKKIAINTLENDFSLFDSYLKNNNVIKNAKTKIIKTDLDTNKMSNSNCNCFHTLENQNGKEKYENAFNCFKLFKNNQKKNNENNNNNINKVINKSILNDLKSKSLLKYKEKSNNNKNRNRNSNNKNIYNVNNSNSTGIRNNDNNKIK